MTARIRIGNAQAFWGDRNEAAAEMLAREPVLDYLTLDYLAEVSMSILAAQRQRESTAGYARDFVEVVRSLAPYWSAGGRCRVIANAGGLNPHGCAVACSEALAAAGCRPLRIGIVSGDDVLELLQAEPAHTDFCNLDSGASMLAVQERLVTANAYLGAAPIVEALAAGAELVITGRVADPSMAVAACMHSFGWTDDDWDKLAAATVAGHLIECGTQMTGGISTDWMNVPDVANLGFPIGEVADDGSCIVTKPRNTGGRVTPQTVAEQLVYEIGDPDNYLSPDVTVSFRGLAVDDLGHDRVRVSGARGRPRPPAYKVSATYRDGFRAAGTLTICGRQAVAKARRCGEVVLQRVRQAGHELQDSVVECLGSGECAAGVVATAQQRDRVPDRPAIETVLRVAVEADAREAVERFAREFMPLITAGPQGTTGYAAGRPRVHPVFRFWPCLIERGRIQPRVDILDTSVTKVPQPTVFTPPPLPSTAAVQAAEELAAPISAKPPSTLFDLAIARSGDKGANANIGVIARNPAAWPLLREWLTAERVAEFFRPLGAAAVERFELPNLHALNFVLHGVLGHGLRTDAQGKAFGQMLLEMPLPTDVAPAISDAPQQPDSENV